MAESFFSGFTEEDLRKMKQENDHEDNKKGENRVRGKAREATNITQNGKKSNKTKKEMVYKSTVEKVSDVVVKEQLLSSTELHLSNGVGICTAKREMSNGDAPTQLKPVKNGLPVIKLRVKGDGHSVEVVNDMESRLSTTGEQKSREATGLCRGEEDGKINCEDMTCHTDADRQPKMTLEEFQWRQKLIEDQNKTRRALLTKALADRRKKTIAETEKLAYIQTELEKLNFLVSNDIAILRKHIETASIEFSEAQKRYEKAEKEFVEVKLELFRKMERKEQLTEHLCTIIEQNEMRKAKKLAELMYELEMDNLQAETTEIDNAEPVLTPLCLTNDKSYVVQPSKSSNGAITEEINASEENNHNQAKSESELEDSPIQEVDILP